MTDPKQKKAEDSFSKHFDELVKGEEAGVTEEEMAEYSEYRSGLATILNALFDEFERDRRLTEERWIKDLRQTRGEYDPKTKAKLHPKRSKAYLSLTRTKVKTVSARMTDLLFPANGDKNWGITPTPIPELNPQTIEAIQLQYQEVTKEQPTEQMVKQLINKEANKRSDAMEKEMADQLSELKYRSTIRNVIKDGNMYGTGILKGPLGKTVHSKRWLPNNNPEIDEDWVTIELKKLLPYCEHVSVWDVYPDMSARKEEDMRGCFQRYVMTRHKVFELAKRPDFKSEAIKSYLKVHRHGDAEYKPFEQDLKNLNDASEQDTAVVNRKGRYELREFWGFLSTDDLADAGVEIDEEDLGLEVAANVWMLGPMVIKATISPIEGVTLPYHFYYYDKDDTSIWGEGIPTIMRDAQKLFNASVRAMLDNAAISAGPILEANMDLLDPDEDPKDLFPFRVFLRDGQGQDATAPAIRVYSLPSYTSEFMQMIQFFMNAADEVTAIPRYMYGDTNQVGGAGKTATGLSMLMGAANVTLKDQVKNFDDGITIPFIKALYFWNMDFNTKEYIKGDFNIVARGSTSLIAREVKAESLMQFMNTTNNEVDLRYTKRANVLREYAKVLDLDDMDLIKDPNTVEIEDAQNAEANAEAQEFEQKLAMIKATSGGHMNDNPAGRPNMEQLSKTELEGGEIPAVEDGSGTLING
jgi:hypothetical protein